MDGVMLRHLTPLPLCVFVCVPPLLTFSFSKKYKRYKLGWRSLSSTIYLRPELIPLWLTQKEVNECFSKAGSSKETKLNMHKYNPGEAMFLYVIGSVSSSKDLLYQNIGRKSKSQGEKTKYLSTNSTDCTSQYYALISLEDLNYKGRFIS